MSPQVKIIVSVLVLFIPIIGVGAIACEKRWRIAERAATVALAVNGLGFVASVLWAIWS